MPGARPLLALITARGGSKGIPRKNLAPLGGKPLILYSLEAARGSRYVDEILVSSDDDEILAACRAAGFATPYRRPAKLATDEAPTMDAVLHALDWLEERGRLPQAVLLLQPTSPLRTASDIDSAVGCFEAGDAPALVGVSPMKDHPFKSLQVVGDRWRYLARPPADATRRQDYTGAFYTINGAIYLATTRFLRERHSFLAESETALFVMAALHRLDIDEPLDLRIAEACLPLIAADAAGHSLA